MDNIFKWERIRQLFKRENNKNTKDVISSDKYYKTVFQKEGIEIDLYYKKIQKIDIDHLNSKLIPLFKVIHDNKDKELGKLYKTILNNTLNDNKLYTSINTYLLYIIKYYPDTSNLAPFRRYLSLDYYYKFDSIKLDNIKDAHELLLLCIIKGNMNTFIVQRYDKFERYLNSSINKLSKI